MWLKRFQLTLVHAAVAITLVPINSTLNRIMIKELAISATLVAALVSIPYLLSPMQVAIGSYADRHPLFGFRRTPYIAIGAALCIAGALLAPYAAFQMASNFPVGILLGLLAFGAWGIGFNFATVSYLSLASELWDEKGRSVTIAVMFFMMIVGIIFTAIAISRVVDPYTPEALYRAFEGVCGVAAVFVILGLIGLERPSAASAATPERHSWGALIGAALGSPQARLFFVYMIVLLIGVHGQDVVLEPFAAEAYGLAPDQTTRITSIWGVCVLLTIAIAGFLQARMNKVRVASWSGVGAFLGLILIAASFLFRDEFVFLGEFLLYGGGVLLGLGVSLLLIIAIVAILQNRTSKIGLARWGAWGAFIGLILIAGSPLLGGKSIFYTGVVLLGLGTGLATVSNLSLMLDMTIEARVGLFIGAWGVADSFARLGGALLGGALRDVITQVTANPVAGYMAVFAVLSALMGASLILLGRIDVQSFQRGVETPSVIETAALVGEAHSG